MKQKKLRSEYPIADTAGIPRTISIIADQKTGIVTTGATQPAYHPDFPWLDQKGKQIHRLRLSEVFRHAAHLCSDNVAQLIKEGAKMADGKKTNELDDDLVERIYTDFMAATKKANYLSKQPRANDRGLQLEIQHSSYRRMMSDRRNEGFEAIPGPKNTIFCWAIDPCSITFKRPCLRCQRMYSEWALYLRPDNTNLRRVSLSDIYARDALAYNAKKDTCSYCAETVAAAKMYLVRNGRLSLI